MPGLWGIYPGVITYRDDPELRGRVKIHVPGILTPERADDGPWALPRGAGAPQWGRCSVPPVGAAVYVQFLAGNHDQPVWEPAWISAPDQTGDGEAERFPEYEHPDVHVWGLGPFRLVVDLRSGQERCELRMLQPGTEEVTGRVLLDAVGHGIQVQADAAVEVSALALVNVDAAVVQVHERKVIANGRAID